MVMILFIFHLDNSFSFGEIYLCNTLKNSFLCVVCTGFVQKTSGCCGVKHGDVFMYNIRMFLIRTCGCF